MRRCTHVATIYVSPLSTTKIRFGDRLAHFPTYLQCVSLVFNLPEGITYGVWNQVQIDTGIENARYATEEDLQDGTPVWSVKRISVRGMEAKVDVVYPEEGIYQLAVVSLKSPAFGTFKVNSFQRFLITAQKPVANNPFDLQEAPSEIAHTDGDSDSSE